MTTIMKVGSLIIILLFTMSNAIAQLCDFTVSIDDVTTTSTSSYNCTADMCVQYDENLPSFYPGIDECENACFVVTVNSPEATNLYIRSSNGYDQIYPNTKRASAVICFGPDSGIPMDVPFTQEQTISGGSVLGGGGARPGGSICTVMIEG